jgi:hypothetical protein
MKIKGLIIFTVFALGIFLIRPGVYGAEPSRLISLQTKD